jgi:predicted negative regulator of RcsB-dependent stress response
MDSRLIGILLVVGMVCWAAYQIWQKHKNEKK